MGENERNVELVPKNQENVWAKMRENIELVPKNQENVWAKMRETLN